MRSLFLVSLIFFGMISMARAQSEPVLDKSDLLTGLESPWDMAFSKDGLAMFYTEKCKGLSVRRVDGTVAHLFGAAGSAVAAPDLFCEGQSGMNGVAVDPNFIVNRRIYVYMSSNLTANPRTNRVVRLVVDQGFSSVTARTDIVTDIPFKNVGNEVGSAGAHSGGRMRFGPDGYLYVTTGDNHNGTLPQDLKLLGGKVLRIDTNGVAAVGNNPPPGADLRIYTYGHRNVQGLAFHPVTGQPFVAEHGPNHSDEITALVPGGNGGWDPKPDMGVECPSDYCGYGSNKADGTLTSMTDTTKFPNAMKPVVVYDDSSGLGPITFLTNVLWKDWRGRMVVGIMGATKVELLQMDNQGKVLGSKNLDVPADRTRSVVEGPDGALYVATDSGFIYKLAPQ